MSWSAKDKITIAEIHPSDINKLKELSLEELENISSGSCSNMLKNSLMAIGAIVAMVVTGATVHCYDKKKIDAEKQHMLDGLNDYLYAGDKRRQKAIDILSNQGKDALCDAKKFNECLNRVCADELAPFGLRVKHGRHGKLIFELNK